MRFNLDLEPREVEAYLRQTVLRLFGNEIENHTKITSGNGRYQVEVDREPVAFSLGKFRKSDVPKVVKTLKFLAGK